MIWNKVLLHSRLTVFKKKKRKKMKMGEKYKTCNFCWHICFRRSTLSFQLDEPPHSYYLFNVFGCALHNYLPRILDGEEDRGGRLCASLGSHIHLHIYIYIYKQSNAPICTNNSTHIVQLDRIFWLCNNNNFYLFLRKSIIRVL